MIGTDPTRHTPRRLSPICGCPIIRLFERQVLESQWFDRDRQGIKHTHCHTNRHTPFPIRLSDPMVGGAGGEGEEWAVSQVRMWRE